MMCAQSKWYQPLLVIALGNLFASQPAQATLVNAALNVYNGSSQSSTLGGYNANKALDGVESGMGTDFTHTNQTEVPFWQVDLGGTMRIEDVILVNRADCCAGRLSDIIVEILDHNDTVVSSSILFNPGNTAFGGAGAVGSGPATLSFTPSSEVFGRTIRVRREAGSTGPDPLVLSLAEVKVMADNVALLAATTQTSGGPGGTSTTGAEAVDGILSNFTHTLTSDDSPTLLLDLGGVYRLDSVILHNRDNCCGNRMTDITVSLLSATDTVLHTSLLNAGNVLVSPHSMGLDLHELTGGAVSGVSKIRITRDITAFQGTDNDVMSFGEVQAFGTMIPEPSSALLLLFGLGLLRRRRA